MSMSHVISVTCDKCPEAFTGDNGAKARDIRAAAKTSGWKLGKQRDFCPKCSAEIAAAVKSAQAGLS